jgi:transposase
MEYFGCDVGKDEVVIFDEQRQRHHQIKNYAQSIQKWIERQNFSDEVLFGCESTGDYHLELCSVCLSQGIPIKVLNPILTNQIISGTIRGKKTDKSDAEVIVKLLQQDQGVLADQSLLDKGKRTLLRTRSQLVSVKNDLKRHLKSLERKQKNMDVSPAIKSVTQSIKDLETQIKLLEQEATQEISAEELIIRTIPGFGALLSAIIASETGSISRFQNAQKLTAFAGLDPKVKQSGNTLYRGSITKRGNPHLRWALFVAAQTAWRFDPELNEFYRKKRAEGKAYRQVMCAIARKLCHRIYSVVSQNRPYEKIFLT